jgi:hypothetical protein
MNQTDWAKIYAKMDKRIVVKYEQLPKGEQIGKRPQAEKQQAKSSSGNQYSFHGVTKES